MSIKAINNKCLALILILPVFLILLLGNSEAARIKDISSIEGVRQNQLIGYGLVVGLDGTGDGDKAKFTIQSLVNMLEKMGITVDGTKVKVDNVAGVVVTGNLPAFVRCGSKIDVVLSSLGDAESLQGGTLLLTPLKAPDGKIYAVAQGPVSLGGFSAGGSAGGGIQKNHPTVGRVPGGAMVEKELPLNFWQRDKISILLHYPDFTTALRTSRVINEVLGGRDGVARALDGGRIDIRVPDKFRDSVVDFVVKIENLEVSPDVVAKVILNERTGTVVMGENVRLSTIAVSHGNLSIEIKENSRVSQPLPFSQGKTTIIPDTEVTVEEEKSRLLVLEKGISIEEVVNALNAIGVSSRDLITIFQAIKKAGALQAELQIM